jgi:hypothetical protein
VIVYINNVRCHKHDFVQNYKNKMVLSIS